MPDAIYRGSTIQHLSSEFGLKIIEYVVPLGPDGRRRVRHVRTGNDVVEFVVQYELALKDIWYPVVRYDTAHGFAHRDVLSYRGNVDKEKMPFDDFGLALTFAENDLRNNWEKYRTNFLKEVNDSD